MSGIKLDQAAIKELVNHPRVQSDLDRRAQAGVDAGREACPVKRGWLRASIHAERKGAGRVVVMGNAHTPYAPYIEYGTRPHYIYPRRAKALWWPTAGFPRWRVYHPGNRPYHVITGAAHDAAKRGIPI